MSGIRGGAASSSPELIPGALIRSIKLSPDGPYQPVWRKIQDIRSPGNHPANLRQSISLSISDRSFHIINISDGHNSDALASNLRASLDQGSPTNRRPGGHSLSTTKSVTHVTLFPATSANYFLSQISRPLPPYY